MIYAHVYHRPYWDYKQEVLEVEFVKPSSSLLSLSHERVGLLFRPISTIYRVNYNDMDCSFMKLIDSINSDEDYTWNISTGTGKTDIDFQICNNTGDYPTIHIPNTGQTHTPKLNSVMEEFVCVVRMRKIWKGLIRQGFRSFFDQFI
jgi:hypothetical protein